MIFYPLTTAIVLLINKNLKLDYENTQAVVFSSVSKNVALTIAICIAIFGSIGQYMALAPSIMSIFQAPFLMIYLKYSPFVKKYLEGK